MVGLRTYSYKKMKKECFILGTRPDIIKFAPLILKMKPTVINTGQHNELAIEALKIFNITPDYNLGLMEPDQTPAEFISNAITNLETLINLISPSRIWVLGDTATAYAGALVGFLYKIPVVHVEAGLRSGDIQNPFPEEMFRICIDRMSSLHFAPTYFNAMNLPYNAKNVYVVGNLIVDSLNLIKPKLSDVRPTEEPYILMTMHRRENFGQDMQNVFEVIRDYHINVVFPAHPNPRVREMAEKIGIKIIEPLNYTDFLWYLKHCEFVMSDSGGIQEEVPSFNKPILILRKITERQEILSTGMATLTNLTKEDLLEKLEAMAGLILNKSSYKENPFGDGTTADKIIEIIK